MPDRKTGPEQLPRSRNVMHDPQHHHDDTVYQLGRKLEQQRTYDFFIHGAAVK